jgi:hypothetical protein
LIWDLMFATKCLSSYVMVVGCREGDGRPGQE